MLETVLGRGPGFPMTSDGAGNFSLATGEELIAGSIRQILGTIPGERPMVPEFGCQAAAMIFENLSEDLLPVIEFYVKEALERWEPRIRVDEVTSEIDETVLRVHILYTIQATGQQAGLEYPYVIRG